MMEASKIQRGKAMDRLLDDIRKSWPVILSIIGLVYFMACLKSDVDVTRQLTMTNAELCKTLAIKQTDDHDIIVSLRTNMEGMKSGMEDMKSDMDLILKATVNRISIENNRTD